MVISLVGNLLIDRIGTVGSYLSKDRLGGIVNVARAIKRKNREAEINIRSCIGPASGDISTIFKKLKSFNRLDIDINKTLPTSRCYIKQLRDGVTKETQTSWGACTALTDISTLSADWMHIAYLDKLPSLQLGKHAHMFDKMSVDFCDMRTASSGMSFDDALTTFGIVFVSSEDILPYRSLQDIANITRHMCVIHGPKENILICNGTIEYVDVPVCNDVCILGAGDYFAGTFIVNHLKNMTPLNNLQSATSAMPAILKALN